MSVRGMFAILLTLIPLTFRSWQTAGCSGLILWRRPVVAAPPRYASALNNQRRAGRAGVLPKSKTARGIWLDNRSGRK
jgi:hypothetical protein